MFITQPLSQRDPRWKGTRLGFSRLTIGSDGCTLTCMTMIVNGLGFSETPATLNDKLRALGPSRGYIGPRMVWAGLGRVFQQIKLTHYEPRQKGAMDMRAIDDALARNKPVLVEVDLSPAPGFQNHWVLLVGRQDDDYIMHDPWTVPAVESESLRKRYGYSGGPAQIIRRAVLYDNPAFNPGRPEPPPESFFIQIGDNPDIREYGGVPLREGPNFLSRELARMPAGASVRCLDTPQAANDKLGVFGEWLRAQVVQNEHALDGYVAAWLARAAVDDDASESSVQPPLERFATASVKRNAKLRAAPSTGAIMATVKPGTVLTLADALPNPGPTRGRWLKVQHGPKEGFVSASFVTVNAAADGSAIEADPAASNAHPQEAAGASDSRPMLRVSSAVGLNLRERPALSARAKKALQPGTLLALREPLATAKAKLGQSGQWISVATLHDIAGYVAAEFVALVTLPDPLVRHQSVALAQGDIHLQRNPDREDISWRVAGGTPLCVAQAADWAKIGDDKAMVRVRTYAMKEGYVRGSQLRLPPLADRREPAHDGAIGRGASAWLYGLQAPYDRSQLGGAKTGWVVFRERIGNTRAKAGSTAYEEWANSGWGVITCLEPGAGQARSVDADVFAQQCAAWVRESRGCRIWVIAECAVNELPARHVAVLFNRARAAIKAAQPQAIVVAAAPRPHPPRPDGTHHLDVFARMLRDITDLDGIALHASTESGAPAQITDLSLHQTLSQRAQYRHFRSYAAFVDHIPARFRRKRLYITHACAQAAAPEPGWATAAYNEIARFNDGAHAQQIHALALTSFPGAELQLREAANASEARWRA